MTRVVPTVETARLRLRASRTSDLDGYAAMLADSEAVRFVGGHVFTREESWRKLLAIPGLWFLLGYGYWAVEEKQSGDYLGQIGFADFKRDMVPSITGIPEMGWMLVPQAQGRGFASEAILGALSWADSGGLPGSEITAIIDEGNLASIRVAEKGGFSVREKAFYQGKSILLFRRRR